VLRLKMYKLSSGIVSVLVPPSPLTADALLTGRGKLPFSVASAYGKQLLVPVLELPSLIDEKRTVTSVPVELNTVASQYGWTAVDLDSGAVAVTEAADDGLPVYSLLTNSGLSRYRIADSGGLFVGLYVFGVIGDKLVALRYSDVYQKGVVVFSADGAAEYDIPLNSGNTPQHNLSVTASVSIGGYIPVTVDTQNALLTLDGTAPKLLGLSSPDGYTVDHSDLYALSLTPSGPKLAVSLTPENGSPLPAYLDTESWEAQYVDVDAYIEDNGLDLTASDYTLLYKDGDAFVVFADSGHLVLNGFSGPNGEDKAIKIAPDGGSAYIVGIEKDSQTGKLTVRYIAISGSGQSASLSEESVELIPSGSAAQGYTGTASIQTAEISALQPSSEQLSVQTAQPESVLALFNSQQLQECQQQLQSCQQEKDSLSQRLQRCQSDLDSCRQNLSSCQSDLSSCQSDLDSCRATLKSAVADFNAGYRRLKEAADLATDSECSDASSFKDKCMSRTLEAAAEEISMKGVMPKPEDMPLTEWLRFRLRYAIAALLRKED